MNISVNLRPAKQEDLIKICQIYNYYIKNSVATFTETPEEPTRFERILTQNQQNNTPFSVAITNDEVVGYAYLSPYMPERTAYRFTYSDAVYIDPNYLGQGIGQKLFTDLISRAKKTDHIQQIISLITAADETKPSIELHQKYGFKVIGTMHKVGYKFDRLLDVSIMQLSL